MRDGANGRNGAAAAMSPTVVLPDEIGINMVSEELRRNAKQQLVALLEAIVGADSLLEDPHDPDDFFNDLSTAIIRRDWFQSLWNAAEWDEIAAVDELRLDICSRYNRLPSWKKFWTSRDGRRLAQRSRQALSVLRGSDGR